MSDFASLTRVVEENPDNLQAWIELASAYLDAKDTTAAARCMEQILQRWPDHIDTCRTLANLYLTSGDLRNAGRTYSQLVQLQPNRVPALVNLAFIYLKLNNFERAIELSRRALEIKPDAPKATEVLANALLQSGQDEEARIAFEKLCRLEPESEIFRYLLSGLSGENQPRHAPNEYVRNTFNGCADNFEHVLVDKLQYRVPELLGALIRKQIPGETSGFTSIDLGCGKGLMGAEIRDLSGHLTGVDLAENMIRICQDKQIYDTLLNTDINTALADEESRYDLIIAADVFIYVGDLDDTFLNISRSLKVNALFAFSIELLDQENGFHLHEHGRYAHTEGYILEQADRAGLSLLATDHITVRMEYGRAVRGINYVFCKSP